MNESPIVGTSRWRSYSSEEHGDGVIEVEVLDHVRCPDSWHYDEREITSNVTGKTRTHIDYYGKDLLQCAVRLETRNGEKESKFVSLARSVRSGSISNEATYRTSCMVRDEESVVYNSTIDEWQKRTKPSNFEMVWELAGSDPISHEDQIEMLLDESHRLFNSRVPISI